MRCPHCNTDSDRVVDSRSAGAGVVIRRRRECLACARRFTTYERIEESPLKVLKKDGSRQDFDRGRLLDGLRRACWKRKHIKAPQLDALVVDIEREIVDSGEVEIPSRQLGEMVMVRLRKLDEVAFVRFASVYREFGGVNQFVDEIAQMQR